MAINSTNYITQEQILELVNTSSPAELFININMDIYNGIFFFVVLVVLFFILTFASYRRGEGGIETHLFSAGLRVSIVAFLMAGVNVMVEESWRGLISDPLLWIFPILTAVIGLSLRTKP